MAEDKGARTTKDVPPDVIAALNAGTRASANLMEGLVVDFAVLLKNTLPDLPAEIIVDIERQKDRGVTRRMEAVGEILLQHLGLEGLARFQEHPSDTVRGWVAFAICAEPKLKFKDRLDRLRPLADDAHFGVREWAWLPLRPHIAMNVGHAISAFKPWVKEKSHYLRRYAVEATRPRGVWSCHLEQLKNNPQLGLTLLTPLKKDPEVYVQDSVANWLNDAGKSQPRWVKELCADWLSESDHPATARICQRALRNLK
jgi:3-methyladenine DNA glycosylase AlkC